MDICSRFGTRLRRLRERRGWSQDDLAAKSGVDRAHISRIENGRREPCLKSLSSLADAFDMSLSKLLSGV